ncbi:hypothetical protein F1529_16965 [Alcanivorax sp. VBW004]|uniref:hypothetical protein n=1 Tax=Alcanivorax sp. VBW004 TaxID=1287708 RepID=UPI0012BBA77C|nr:hypothetical protein [Alcanivorax sp. VBW004]MTT54178.1 hypothetical protein [Alcanivorax sp. VBW004]
MRYEGYLDVEGGDFELEAQPIILRDSNLSFVLKGRDEFGFFRVEGLAAKTEYGFFLASRVPLIYPDYDAKNCNELATIRFDKITLSESMEKCNISGIWKQIKGEEWKFDGVIISVHESPPVL